MTDLLQVQAQADRLGIKYHHRAGAPKIQAAIDHFLVEQQSDSNADLPPAVTEQEVVQQKVHTRKVIPMTSAQYQKKKLGQKRKQAGAMIRCLIVCMNPEKKEWPGEIISVGSAKLGTFKKFVPFNTGEPYHLPKIIFDMMKERKCSVFYDKIDSRGVKRRVSRRINEFNLEELPPLTREELKELSRSIAMEDGRQGEY